MKEGYMDAIMQLNDIIDEMGTRHANEIAVQSQDHAATVSKLQQQIDDLNSSRNTARLSLDKFKKLHRTMSGQYVAKLQHAEDRIAAEISMSLNETKKVQIAEARTYFAEQKLQKVSEKNARLRKERSMLKDFVQEQKTSSDECLFNLLRSSINIHPAAKEQMFQLFINHTEQVAQRGLNKISSKK